jgi:hypothetical protein
MKSAIWKRQVWPFQWTMEPPSPVPGRNPLIRRSGSAVWSTLARTVMVSRVVSIISDLRIAKRNSSCMAGDWKSGTVSRSTPRSSPTTLRPAAASSFARMEPVMPTPIVTASTGRNRSAMPCLTRFQGSFGGMLGSRWTWPVASCAKLMGGRSMTMPCLSTAS